MVKVSVIVPVYNTRNYIHRLLASLETQTYRNFEVIFVDDHSNDGTYEILKEFRDKNPDWVHIERTPRPRSGPSLGRNIGLDISSGKYIAFIDSDDWWSETFLEDTVEAIYTYGGVYTGYYDIFENGSSIRYDFKLWGETNWRSVLTMRVRFGIGNTLLRGRTIRKYSLRFPEERNYSEDSYFFLSYLSITKNLFGVNKYDFYRLIRQYSLSHKFSGGTDEAKERIRSTIKNYNELCRFVMLNSPYSKEYCSYVRRGPLPGSIITYITSVSDSNGRACARKLIKKYWVYIRSFRPRFNYTSLLILLWLIDPFVPVRQLLKSLRKYL